MKSYEYVLSKIKLEEGIILETLTVDKHYKDMGFDFFCSVWNDSHILICNLVLKPQFMFTGSLKRKKLTEQEARELKYLKNIRFIR